MRDDDNRLFQRLIQRPENIQDLISRFGIHGAGRFICQQECRFVCHGDGNGNALLFAAGELVNFVFHPVFQADQFQQHFRTVPPFTPVPAARIDHRLNHIVVCAQKRKHIAGVVLPDETDLIAFVVCHFLFLHAEHIVAMNGQTAC